MVTKKTMIMKLSCFNCCPRRWLYSPVQMRYISKKNLTIFEGCHFPQFYILILSSFLKIETKNFNSDPCFFNLVTLETISPAAHFLSECKFEEIKL